MKPTVHGNVVTYGDLRLSISAGNTKVPYPAVSLAPVRDCVNCQQCSGDCYALRPYRQYPDVRAAWDANGDLFRHRPWAGVAMVGAWLDRRRKPVPYFRIHVSGDFLSQSHVAAWTLLARLYPETVFYAYTKSHHLDFSDLPVNLVILHSQWTGTPVAGEGRRAWYQDGTESRMPENAVVCPATKPENKGMTCDRCNICAKSKRDVVFLAH